MPKPISKAALKAKMEEIKNRPKESVLRTPKKKKAASKLAISLAISQLANGEYDLEKAVGPMHGTPYTENESYKTYKKALKRVREICKILMETAE